DPATVDPATVDPATVDPAPVDPAAVDPASVELVAELTVAEALWRPFNRWIVEGNLTKADGTTDVGGFVIAELVKAAGTRIEIGRATVDILPVPGFDIANRPISPAILNNVDVEKDHVEVSAISSDGSQQFKVVSFINAAPEPIAHVGTEVVLEAVEILTDNRVVIHGYASFQGAAATGVAVITTDVSNQLFEAELVPAPDPLAGGFDFVKRPIFGNGGFIDGETLTVTVDDVGFATSVVDLSAETVFIPAVADPVVVAALETTVAGLAPVDPAAVDPATVDPAAVDPAAVDPAPIHVEPLPISPITSASEATTHGLQSLRTAVISDGGVPLPGNLGEFVRDREAAIKLGKALFWDMQMGSDGIQACASCHYKAGADGRSQNQMNPDMLSFVNEREGDIKGYFDAQSSPDTVFHTAGPNESVVASDYPFVKKIQDYVQNDDGSIGPAPGNSNDITSSMGVFLTLFKGSVEAQAVDWGDRLEDPVFNAERADNAVYMANGNTIRRVPHRNAPSTYNAVFNFTNFWDGRANPDFNGQNSFGQQDQNAKVWVQQSDGSVLQEAIVMNNASLASQAVGPALSHFEMSFGNPSAGNARTFPEIGKKLLRGSAAIVPLGQQIVDPDDSVLGALSLSPSPGLNVDYKTLVYAAFKPEYWGFDGRFELNQAQVSSEVTAGYLVVETIEGTSTEATATEASSPDAVDELSTYGQYLTAPDASTEKARFTQAEANFAMIFGISVMMYESTLISDQTPYDQWMETGELNDGFGAEELNGLNVFTGKAGCVACHVGPELTNATVRYARDEIIEPMPMAEGFALYDNGFYNLGVTPTTDDIGRGGKDLNGKPLAFSRQALFNRSGIQSMGFPIKGNETVPTTGELGNIVCADADADGFCDSGTSIVPEFQRVAVDGAFKTPGLRNSELTGPYFHNGGMATLKQVVEFYDRGGNFCGLNLHDLSPDMSPLGLSDVEKDELTAFMVALTDDRVKYSKAPFDHPQLLIPTDGFQDSLEELHEIPAVGAGGSEAALTTFLGLDPQDSIFTPEGICSNGAVPHL
ncbi:MAG: cytochrome c peroxidase, partial [Pseudomonadales bacterium]